MQKLQDEKSLQHPGELHKVWVENRCSKEPRTALRKDLFPKQAVQKELVTEKKAERNDVESLFFTVSFHSCELFI